MSVFFSLFFFFFNDTATTEIYTFPYTTLFRSRLELGSQTVGARVAQPGADGQLRLLPQRHAGGDGALALLGEADDLHARVARRAADAQVAALGERSDVARERRAIGDQLLRELADRRARLAEAGGADEHRELRELEAEGPQELVVDPRQEPRGLPGVRAQALGLDPAGRGGDVHADECICTLSNFI